MLSLIGMVLAIGLGGTTHVVVENVERQLGKWPSTPESSTGGNVQGRDRFISPRPPANGGFRAGGVHSRRDRTSL